MFANDHFHRNATDECEKCHKEKPLNISKLCSECLDLRREQNRERIDLYVPFEDRELVKSLGARWDSDKKKWYANHYLIYVNEVTGFQLCKYLSPNVKVYYSIPYALKDEAKQLGAKWDSEVKKWYVWSINDTLNEKFMKYKDEKTEWEKILCED